MRFKPLHSVLWLSFLLLCHTGFSQQEPTPFGAFTANEIAFTQCAFDPEAEAVVLLDQARSYYDDQHQLITERRIRIKILKERGIERGNIRIHFYSANHFETIRNVNAVVLNFDGGKAVRKALERKSIYEKKQNAYYSDITFALPDVRVGSLFEYQYESVMEHYGGLREWVFQKDIPVLLSSYNLTIVPNAEFAYSVYKSPFMPITVNRDAQNGSMLFQMRDIAGLRNEAYMGAPGDYLQRVTFQLSGINHRVDNNGYTTTVSSRSSYTDTWGKLARELLESREFGHFLTKPLPDAEALQAAWRQTPDAYTKMKTIHGYMRSHFNWNGVYSIHTENGLKGVWEKRTGTKGEINLVLINLLKQAGLEVSPLLVSERDHGKVDTAYPYMSQFSNVVAYVRLGDTRYILDATDQQTPVYMIPFPLLNTTGFVVDKKAPALLRITDSHRKNLSLINLTAAVGDDRTVQLQAEADDYDYAKLERVQEYNGNKNEYKKKFLAPFDAAMVDSFAVAGAASDSGALHHAASVHYGLEQAGDYSLLRYNFFTGFDKNPFLPEQRFTDVDFGCAYTTILNATFTLPAHLAPESLPKNIKLMLPDQSMSVVRQIQQDGNTIKIGVRIEFLKTVYSIEEYQGVQGFYKQLLELLNEPVVLKPKA